MHADYERFIEKVKKKKMIQRKVTHGSCTLRPNVLTEITQAELEDPRGSNSG